MLVLLAVEDFGMSNTIEVLRRAIARLEAEERGR